MTVNLFLANEHVKERREVKCQEEIEQDQEVRDLGQVKEQGEVALARAGEEVLRQDLAVIAFVPIVAKKRPISWEALVMSRNVPNAAPP